MATAQAKITGLSHREFMQAEYAEALCINIDALVVTKARQDAIQDATA